jgi:isoleucyl-tRNA synthetase
LPVVYFGKIFENIDRLNEFAFIAERNNQWQLLRDIRDAVLKAIEEQREKGLIKHPLEAQVTLHYTFEGDQERRMKDFEKDLASTGQSLEDFFAEFFIVSRCIIAKTKGTLPVSTLKHLSVLVERASGQKCPRCWKYDSTGHKDNLCARCQKVVV